MLPIDPTHDYAQCGGPRRCHYCVEILNETPERGYERRMAEDRTRGLRTAAQDEYAPPDPYEKELAVLRLSDARAAAAKTHQPAPRSTEIHLDSNGIPDPYFHDLERMRGANR